MESEGTKTLRPVGQDLHVLMQDLDILIILIRIALQSLVPKEFVAPPP